MTNAVETQRLIEHRQQFPALKNKLYFNYGGQGPLSQSALDAIQSAYLKVQEIGPFTGASNRWITEQVEGARGAIATQLNVDPSTITLTDSVSTGCNIALWGLNWKPGDHLLVTDCEHPSVFATAQQLQRRFGIEFSICPILNTLNEGDPIASVVKRLKPQTRMLGISHVLWNTGQVLPLQAISQACRQQNPDIIVMVDAAQSVGVLPLSLAELDVDCYAFTGHKWWCGPDGLGGLYVSPSALEKLEPTYMGWRGVTVNPSGYPTGWKPDGRRFEIATSAYPLFVGLTAALECQQQWGSAEDRYQRILQLSQLLWQQLREIPNLRCLRSSAPEASLVSFTLDGLDHSQFVQDLERDHIMVRLIADPHCIRACVHYLTLETEIEQLTAKIAEISGKL
ncbi:MAG: aminotransferase class V-fold PLP-dependent enzyme [Thermosynechococcaceae cyanobacterium]